jgi:hypothetical protein
MSCLGKQKGVVCNYHDTKKKVCEILHVKYFKVREYFLVKKLSPKGHFLNS